MIELKKMGFEKRGQITIFVIVGLILLVGAGLTFYLLSPKEVVQNFEDGVTESKPSFKPAQTYVENCIREIGREGLNELGSHGGYIEPLTETYGNNFLYEESSKIDSDGVFLTDNSLFIPFWLHSTTPVSSKDIDIDILIPSIDLMQNQLALYVNNNLDSCVDDLRAIDELGFELRNKENPRTEVYITDEDVVFKVTMNFELEKDGEIQQFEKFLAREDVPLKDMVDNAKRIVFEEYENNYLENLLVQLIGFHGNMRSDSLPPMSMYSTSQSVVVWTQIGVNEQLKSLLDTYVQLFRFEGTKNGIPILDEEFSEQEKSFYNSFLLPSFNTLKEDLEINHLFLHWDIYSKVNSPNSDSQIITVKPSESTFLAKAPDYETSFEFYYDISYPVIVELKQKMSDASDYTFLFAMEGNLRRNLNNQDYEDGKGMYEWDTSSATVVESLNNIPELNADSSNTEFFEETFYPLKTLFGDESQFKSGNITLKTYDLSTGESIVDVLVYAGIGDYAKVDLGKTSFNVYGSAFLSSKAPIMNNGFLLLRKFGYQDVYVPITTTQDTPLDLGSIGLSKKQNKKILVKVINETSLNENLDSYRDVYENEQIIVYFTKITGDLESPFTQILIVNNSEESEIELIPGRYLVSGFLIDFDGIVIPKDSKSVCDTWASCMFISEEDRYIPNEPLPLKPMMWGGIEINQTFPWFISSQDLYNQSTYIELPVLKLDPPTSIDSLDNLNRIGSYFLKNRYLLMPQIRSLN